MVQSKTELFDKKLAEKANLFKAMENPARLHILQFLAETKTCITGDICEELPLSRTTVNQHLKELQDSGLIIGEINGVKTNYCLNADKISLYVRAMNYTIKRIIKSQLGKYVGALEMGNGIWRVFYRSVFLVYFYENELRTKEKSVRLKTNLV